LSKDLEPSSVVSRAPGVQRLVDRRFNRARYDAAAIVAAFNAQLRDAVDLDTVRNELVHAVHRSPQP
jgi:hypothetical protein